MRGLIYFWWRWGTFGRCRRCGQWGLLLKSEHAHELCWLEEK